MDPPTGGSVVRTTRCRSQYLMVRRRYRSPSSSHHRETVRAARTPRYCHHLPGILKLPIRRLFRNRHRTVCTTRLRTLCGNLLFVAPPTPTGLVTVPWGDDWFKGRNVPSMPHRHRETHPPGIKYSPSESYAEIGADSLGAGKRALCATLPLRPRPTPACPAYRGVKCGSLRVAMFDCQTTVAALLELARRNAVPCRAPLISRR
jgi:hypothetical protein